MIKRDLKHTLLILVFLLCNVFIFSQRIQVRSFAEPNIVGRDDLVTYTIEIKGDKGFKAETPKLPDMKDFSMRNMMSSSASNYSIVNGTVSESITKSFIYRLLPKKVGNLIIPDFIINVNGNSYHTQQVSVRVLDKSTAGQSLPKQGNPFSYSQGMPLFMQDPFDMDYGFEPVGEMFLRATPDKKTVFLGEPLLVTYRLYTTQPVTSLELKEEKDSGGYGKEIYSEPNRLNFELVKIKNQRYQVAVIKTLSISPNKTGELEMPRITAVAQMGRMGLYRQTLVSEPVFINVVDLPKAGKPDDYSGAVGAFKVSDRMEKTSIRIGEALEYKLTITGKGNFNQFSNPVYPLQQEFRIASPITNNRIQAGVSGTRTISYMLIPKREGSFTLPGVSFNWFDPVTAKYQYFSSSPITVEIKPGNVLTYISNVFQKDNIRTLTPFVPKQSYKSTLLLVKSPIYWLLAILILLTLLPSGWFAYQRNLKYSDPELATQKSSERILKKYLKQAELAAQTASNEFYPKAEQGLMRYLSDKYHIPHRFSTQEKLYHLHLKGIDNELIGNLDTFLKHCQEARFMPGGFSEQGLAADLDFLKKVIRDFISHSAKTKKRFW